MTLREQVLHTMDPLGIIGQTGHPEDVNGTIDGGDSINRMSHYHFTIEANKEIGNNIADLANLPSRTKKDFEEDLILFECPDSPGNYRRHPTDGWASFCGGTYDGNMSRDQSFPLIIAMAFMGMYKRLGMYFIRHLMRGLLFTNNTRKNGKEPSETPWKLPDLTGPEFFSVYLRAIPILGYLLYPILCILDLELLVSAFVWSKFRKDDDDIVNFCDSLIFANMRVKTPISYLATKLVSKQLIIDKLKSHWCHWRESCFFVNLYEPLIERFVK